MGTHVSHLSPLFNFTRGVSKCYLLSWMGDSQNTHVLTVKIRQPSHEFTFGVGMSFIPYPLVLTPVV
jgi:hypothetical protein